LVFLLTGCTGQANSNTTNTQTATVQRGSISISVTGTGNLVIKNKQELSFGQTGLVSQATNAKISDVNVVAGQLVKKGQVLVTADTTDWQDQLVTDQHNLYSAQAAVTSAQGNVTQAQANVAQAQTTLLQDQSNLVNAQQNLNAQQDVQEIQTRIDNYNIQLQQAKVLSSQSLTGSGSSEYKYWNDLIVNLSVDTDPNSNSPRHIPDGGQIGVLQKQMSKLLEDPANAGATLVTSAISATVIQQYTLAVKLAQQKIVMDQANLAAAQANIGIAQNNVVVAQNKVDDFQRTLTQNKNSAQEISAPFDGLITIVNVSKGDIVQRSAALVEIADPSRFEARIMVTERDVNSLNIGKDANVTFNALPGLTFTAKVTQIAPLATIQQGVVNYQVTVELTSNEPVKDTKTTANNSPVTLKQGFAVVVTIPILQKDNILTLPNRALTHQGQNYVVQVKNGATTETRIVKIGITDYLNTEIVEGLNQGDQVVISAIPTSTSTNSGNPFGGG
jgi:RND family efflux transporter MFP subunit